MRGPPQFLCLKKDKEQPTAEYSVPIALIVLVVVEYSALCKRLNRDVALVLTLLGEDHLAIDESIEGIVLTETYVEAWVVLGATLTNEDVASLNDFATKLLNAETLAS